MRASIRAEVLVVDQDHLDELVARVRADLEAAAAATRGTRPMIVEYVSAVRRRGV